MSWITARAVLVTAGALLLTSAITACDREPGYAMRQPRQRRGRYYSQPGYPAGYYQQPQPYYGNPYNQGGYYQNGYGNAGYQNSGGYYAQPGYQQQPVYEPNRGRSGYSSPGYQNSPSPAYVQPPSRAYSPGPSYGSPGQSRGGVPNVGPR